MSKKEKNKSDENKLENKDSSIKEDSNEGVIPYEIFEAIPEEDRGRVASIIRQTMISGVMRKSNPIAEKITTDHITQIISKSDEQDKRDRDERNSERKYNISLVVLGLLFVGFLVVFLQTNENLLINIIVAIISFIGGFGFGKTSKKR